MSAHPPGRPDRACDPRSLHITGTVEDWESWTGMRFPETGDDVFPVGLAPVHIDRDTDLGEHPEPNIWIIHQLSSEHLG